MHPGVFAPGVHEPDRARVTFGLGKDNNEGLRFHLFASEHPLDITRYYYEITGFPGTIAPWALGPWIWRDEVENQAAVIDDLNTIRDLDLPTTGYWIDRPYASAVNSFDFKPEDYPNPETLFGHAKGLGFEMALWHTPYVDPEDEATKALYDEAEEKGYFAPEMGTALAKWGPPLDFSNPDAMDWWQEQLQP
jgi:alpha-D-xyloside xylohydrolase